MEVLRLVTVHPTLVHLTLGLVPAMLLAYGVAVARRSAPWTFVGDVLLAFAAVATIATAASGLVSNAVLDWPGNLGTWRWLHLGAGAATTLLLLGMVGLRFRRRRGDPVARRGLAAAAGVAFVLAAFTGWIGGEVLVYHSGMAVKAAADGALSPPLDGDTGTPGDVHESMERLRETWAAAKTELVRMVVTRPDAEGFQRLEGHARRIETLGSWLAQQGRGGHDHGEGEDHGEGDDHGEEAGSGPDAGGDDPFVRGGRTLRDHGRALLEAAGREDIAAASEALGRTTTTCAGCHAATRWKD